MNEYEYIHIHSVYKFLKYTVNRTLLTALTCWLCREENSSIRCSFSLRLGWFLKKSIVRLTSWPQETPSGSPALETEKL